MSKQIVFIPTTNKGTHRHSMHKKKLWQLNNVVSKSKLGKNDAPHTSEHSAYMKISNQENPDAL